MEASGVIGIFKKEINSAPPTSENRHPEIKKMVKCARKAIEEHHLTENLRPLNLDVNLHAGFPMSLTIQTCALRGRRSYMEDSFFHKEIKKGKWLLGVCDGHTDKGLLGRFVAKECKERFVEELEKANGNVKLAFQNLFKSIHEKRNDAQCFGTTVVICYIDEKKGIVYTATLGDSEALICRKIEDQFYIIPISLVRNWSNPREAKRAAEHYRDHDVVEIYEQIMREYPNHPHPKELRVPPKKGLNVSRAIGDKQYDTIISQNPTVTINQLLPGDKIFIYSDGAGDVINYERLLKKIIIPCWDSPDEDMADRIAHYAIEDCNSSDNTTVLVASIEKVEKENISPQSNSPGFEKHKPSKRKRLESESDSSDYTSTESYPTPSPQKGPSETMEPEEKEEEGNLNDDDEITIVIKKPRMQNGEKDEKEEKGKGN